MVFETGTRSRRYWRCVAATESCAAAARAATSSRKRATSASSFMMRLTPSRFTPSAVNSWMRRRAAKSASEKRREPPLVRWGFKRPLRS